MKAHTTNTVFRRNTVNTIFKELGPSGWSIPESIAQEKAEARFKELTKKLNSANNAGMGDYKFIYIMNLLKKDFRKEFRFLCHFR